MKYSHIPVYILAAAMSTSTLALAHDYHDDNDEEPFEGAEKAVGKLLELEPEACISGFRQQLPFKNPEHLQILLEGFQKAGLPQ